MSNFSDIKRRLSMSTTMPASPLMGGAHPHSSHEHEVEDEECDEDHTNPTGGCGCGCR